MLKTLFFPTTIPQQGTIRQLLLFFDEVFQYAPAEDSVADQTPLHNFHHYAPVPFAERLERFQQLFKSIKNNLAEYYGGGLSMLSRNAVMDLDESAVWRLIEILSPKDTQSKSIQTLDQSRLLLKLAETADLEELEINQGLSVISKKAKTLLDDLKGELDAELAEIDFPLPPPANARSVEKRTRAWIHLYLADEKAADFWILATNQETFEYVSDHASPFINHRPERLLSLNIAEMTSLSDGEFSAMREDMRKGLNDSLKNIEQKLRRAAESGSCQEYAMAAELTAWNENIKKNLAGQASKARIEFYLFPQSLPELFMKIVKSASPTRPVASAPAHAIIAVLKSHS